MVPYIHAFSFDPKYLVDLESCNNFWGFGIKKKKFIVFTDFKISMILWNVHVSRNYYVQ